MNYGTKNFIRKMNSLGYKFTRKNELNKAKNIEINEL